MSIGKGRARTFCLVSQIGFDPQVRPKVKKMTVFKTFSNGDYVVYPAHGVGRVTGVETQQVAGMELQVYVIAFDKDRMTLRLPTAKSHAAGLRSLSSQKQMEQALKVLKTRTRIRRTMWSRRAQEYENKINSGDPASIAEVIRDLHRNSSQQDQSYSERQIYKAALDRFTRELAVIEDIDEAAAVLKIEEVLSAA
jgi:CarD family transcriptional regulator